MLERKQRRPYWRTTRAGMLACVLALLVSIPLLPSLISALNTRYLMGFPLGYLMATHGLVVMAIALVVWQTRRQDRVDRRFGAHEDF